MEEYEEYEEVNENQEQPTPLTYEEIYNATYNAILDANTELEIRAAENQALEEEEENLEFIPEEEVTTETPIYDVNVTNFPSVYNIGNYEDIDFHSITDAMSSDVLQFATNTDATLYTVTTQSAIGSADAQSVALMLEIRNIILIFFFAWFITYLIRIIKNTVMKFTKGKGDSI